MPAPPSWRRDLTLLFFAVLAFYCIGLGARPYVTPSEARYIEIPRQMLVTHDWLTPRIDGVPYFEKPPLFYWLQASVMSLFGTGEFAGRIVTAILSTLLACVTYATARMLYGRTAGWLAATVLATCLLSYGLSRAAMVDVPVSLFLTCIIACFLAAQYKTPSLRGGKGKYYLLMYVAAGLAVMSKGLIGIVIPGLVIGGWIALTGRWRILREARLVTGLFIVLLITAPWHMLMQRIHPHFFEFYFIHEHFARYLTDEAKRIEPWWFFLAILPAGLLPWTFLAPHSLRGLARWKKNPDPVTGARQFLLLWILLPLFFFSASHSKLVPYILPVFPPIAILIGCYLARLWEGEAEIKPLRRAAILVLLLFGGALLAYFMLPLAPDNQRKVDFGSISWQALLPIMLALIGLAYLLVSRRSARVLIGALAAFAMIAEMTANYAAGGLDRATIKPLLPILTARLKPGDTVVAYGTYFQDLPVYLNRNVTVAGYTGELEFGVDHYPETHGWMISAETFWQRCATAKQPVYVFMKRGSLDALSAIAPNSYVAASAAMKESDWRDLMRHYSPDSCRLRLLAEYGKTVLLEKEF